MKVVKKFEVNFDVQQFRQSFDTSKLLVSLFYNLQVFTPLYRGVRDTLMIASTSKRVVVEA